MTDNEQRIFKIPSPNLPKFKAKLEQLQKRAKKLNAIPPTFTIIQEEKKTIQVLVDETEDLFGRTNPVYEDRIILLYHIRIDSPNVVVEGYEFISALEHTSDGNVLHTLKGKTLPSKYRDASPWCDHCKMMRNRKETFVLKKIDDGSYLQVGRNCLADFLGRNAEIYASQAELYFEFDEYASACEEEGSGGWGGGGERFEDLEYYLAFVAETIALKGWRSRSTAFEHGGESTSDIACKHMRPTSEFLRYGEVLFRTPTEKSVEAAKAAIAWCESLTDEEIGESDYLHNIRVISRRGVIGGRQFGMAASIVSSHQRHLGELKRKEFKARNPSNWVGTVGERIIFNLTIDHVVALPDYGYGSSSLHLMHDEQGNRFTWKSTTTCLEVGQTYMLRGTVKAHDEYKEEKQTKLGRCEKVELHTFTSIINGEMHEVLSEDEKSALKQLREKLGMKKLPKGTKVERKEVAK